MTRENIDALNAKFANLQNPPSMYIIGKCHSIFRFFFFFMQCLSCFFFTFFFFFVEYQELTSKLHELETKELELERLQQPEEEPEVKKKFKK